MSRNLILAIVLLVATQSFVNAQQTTCKALILEGGGDLGAYEAGVIQGFVDNLPADQIDWDFFVGISVGSLMAAGLGQYEKGQEQDMVNWVTGLWEQITKDDIYANWPGGLLQGLLFEPGLYDTSPLREYLSTHITQPLVRGVSLGTTDANTGDLIRYNETLSASDLVEACLCSSAVPCVFPYQNFQGYTFFDGGVAVMQDAIGGILRCLEIVDDPSQITLDMIFIADPEVTAWAQNGGQKTFDVYERQSKIQSYFKAFQEYTITQQLYPEVNYRYIVRPSTPLPDSSFPFFFEYNQTIQMINQGIQDAQNCIAQGDQCHLTFERDAYLFMDKVRGKQVKGEKKSFEEHTDL